MKISVITPSVRPEFIQIVAKCLSRQTFEPLEFEWIIIAPKDKINLMNKQIPSELRFNYIRRFYDEPEKREGDYYSLNKAWNEGIRHAMGELIIEITDGIWFPPDTLQKLWDHYEANPKACVTTIGHQYDQIVNGKPEHLVWQDPRCRADLGSFYEINPNDLELCLGSIPKQAILDVGGLDEEYDKGAALSEKEMALRMDKAGYKFYLDQSIEYRAIKHPRLNDQWDEKYKIACELFATHLKEILHGNRMRLDNFDKSVSI